MSMAIIWDLLLGLCLIAVIWNCWRQGFVSALLSLIGVVAGYVGAAILSAPISRWIYEALLRENLISGVAQQLPEQVGGFSPESAEQLSQLAQLGDEALEAIHEALEQVGITQMPLGGGESLADSAQKVLDTLAAGGSTLAEAVVDTVMAPVILFLIQAVCFLVIFSIISLVFRFLVSLGRGVNHIPVVGQLNQLLGLGVGVVKAAIEGYIAVLLLMLIVGLTKGSLDFLNYQVLEDTVLIRWIAGWPLPF